MRVLLASASPRRRTLLEAAGLDVQVVPSNIDERRLPGLSPVAHARSLAERKALAAGLSEHPIVAADTVVHRGDVLFDKPLSREEAASHIRALSGGWHDVTTAVCVRHGALSRLLSVSTKVRFRALSERDVIWYVSTGEADDKAGAYGIQGAGGSLVAEIVGSYTSVVGLPLEETLALLSALQRDQRSEPG